MVSLYFCIYLIAQITKRIIPPPGRLSGILQLCPPQNGAFAVTGQPGVGHCQRQFYLFDFNRRACLVVYQLNFLSAPRIKILKLSWQIVFENRMPTPTPTWEFFQLEWGKGPFCCGVPLISWSYNDFAIVERLRKFNCSSPSTYFLIAVEQIDFLSNVVKFVFIKHPDNFLAHGLF